ncbi:hypothetical protein EFR00_13355 [Rhizobium sophoriradicis]|nr:hypothetical protein EFR00_13355 [Rhizobium sophoriradicis]
MRHNGSFATRESFGFDTERHDVEKRPASRTRAPFPLELAQPAIDRPPASPHPRGREDKQLLKC